MEVTVIDDVPDPSVQIEYKPHKSIFLSIADACTLRAKLCAALDRVMQPPPREK